jgi:eukaryotic-like serine/threonine-protein kinase
MASGDDLLGRMLGSYRVERKLGSGATGVVFRAQREGEPPRALKVLHDNLGSITGLRRRFEREARVLKKLHHKNIVEITDFGVIDGHTFIAMELLDGHTLEDRLGEASIDPQRAIEYYFPILEALAIAHEQSVVHRDLKPANVFLTKSGDVKVLDFGLAKMLSIDDVSQEGTLTRRGRIVGTPAYMAPEQITGVFVDVRADVYALGVMLFELLADRRPFLYERRSELLRAHLLEPVPKITTVRPGLWISPELETLLARALTKDPGERYQHAGVMLDALRALPPNSARIRMDGPRSEERKRTEAISAIISSSERKAITEEVLTSSLAPKPSSSELQSREPSKGGVPTTLLFGLALFMLAAAAGLWIYFITMGPL